MNKVTQADVDAAIRQFNGMIRSASRRGQSHHVAWLIEFVQDLEKARVAPQPIFPGPTGVVNV